MRALWRRTAGSLPVAAGAGSGDRERELARLAVRPHHAAVDPRIDLAEELVHELGLADLPQHLAVGVDEPGVPAAGDPEVGVPRLARPVHRAAHDRDLEVLRVALQPALDLHRE